MNNLQAKWNDAVRSYEENAYDPSEKIARWERDYGTPPEIIFDLIKNLIAVAEIFKGILQFEQGDKVLDLGCGNGFFYGKSYESEGYAYLPNHVEKYGLDVIRNDVFHGKRFAIGNAQELPFKPRSFDGAVCVSALDHFLHPERTFSSVFGVLKQNAAYYIMTKTVICPKGTNAALSTNKHHIFEFSPFIILEMYWDAGFRNIGYVEVVAQDGICVFWGMRP